MCPHCLICRSVLVILQSMFHPQQTTGTDHDKGTNDSQCCQRQWSLLCPHPIQPFGMLHASHSSPLECFLSLASITSHCLGFCPNDTGYSFLVTIVGSNSLSSFYCFCTHHFWNIYYSCKWSGGTRAVQNLQGWVSQKNLKLLWMLIEWWIKWYPIKETIQTKMVK